MQICPVNREWIHNYVLEPYLQGAALLNRAWKGIDFHSLIRTPLSLKERAISWLTGMVLMTPFINTIIWLAWQTFGRPEILFDPYSPEVNLPPPPSPTSALVQPAVNLMPAAPPAQVAPSGDARPAETFAFNETFKNSMIKTNWKVEQYPTSIVARQYCNEYSSTSRYDPNWVIQEYHFQSGEASFDIWLTDSRHVRVRIVPNGGDPVDQTLELTEAIPWIQQPTLGFKRFILSNETEMPFYGVLCENPLGKYLPFSSKPPLIMKAIAKKVGEEEFPVYGKLIKVEVQSDWGWPYNLVKAELWFDPQTGALRKFIDPGFITKKSGDFILSPSNV